MNRNRYNELLTEIDSMSHNTMHIKNDTIYATGEDRLHNFKAGAEIAGRTPAQTAWGYMTKHLVALRDKVERNDFSNREDLAEKCQDSINYIKFIWLCANEEIDRENPEEM